MFLDITGDGLTVVEGEEETKGVACGELVESGVGETVEVGVFTTTSPLFLENLQPINTTTKTTTISKILFILFYGVNYAFKCRKWLGANYHLAIDKDSRRTINTGGLALTKVSANSSGIFIRIEAEGKFIQIKTHFTCIFYKVCLGVIA